MSKKLPGPRGWPLLGNLPQMSKEPLGFLEGLRDYGPLAGFSMGPIPGVVVLDPELVHEVFTRKNKHMRKSIDTRWLGAVLGDGLVSTDGEFWKRHRRTLQPAFHNQPTRGYANIMDARAQDMLERWRPGQEIELNEEMSRVTLEIVCKALFGVDAEPHVEAVGEALHHVMTRFEELVSSPLPIPPQWSFWPKNFKVARAKKILDEVFDDIIRQRRKNPEGDDLLSKLLQADAEHAFSDTELRDELLTLLAAGHETTALALTWALWLVAQHPDIETRLVSEAAALTDVGEAEKQLPLHYRVVHESMRLYPPVWGMGREVIEPFELGGYSLKKGTQVYLVQWVTHRDPKYFADPERFDPDRWLEPKHPKHAYFPFGGGPRVCIGMHFALLESTLILARVLERFRLDIVPNQEVDLMPAVTLRPRHGIRAVLRERVTHPAEKSPPQKSPSSPA